MIISPNLGAIGAPQVGHFNDVAPKGAIIGSAGAAVCFGGAAATLAPHFKQNTASSGSWAPHLGQYKINTPRHIDLNSTITQQLHHPETASKLSNFSPPK
jgi:hypothetical protein